MVFCYDAVISGFSLHPIPWIEIQVASPKLGNRMRGDQLARRWGVIRGIEARPKGMITAKEAFQPKRPTIIWNSTSHPAGLR